MMISRRITSLLALSVSAANALVSPSGSSSKNNNNNNLLPVQQQEDIGSINNPPTTSYTRRGVFSAVAKGVGSVAVASSLGGNIMGLPLTANAANSIPPTGVKAPSFNLPNSRGEGTTSLNDLTKNGKWTVLYFYPGAFTSGCTLEARYFQRDIDQYRKLNAQIVGVSVDPVEKNAQFCSAENLDFFMLSDQGGQVSKTYGSALSIPGFGTFSNRQTYLIDPKGNLRWIFADVESHIPRHSEEVLAKLQDLESEVKA